MPSVREPLREDRLCSEREIERGRANESFHYLGTDFGEDIVEDLKQTERFESVEAGNERIDFVARETVKRMTCGSLLEYFYLIRLKFRRNGTAFSFSMMNLSCWLIFGDEETRSPG